MCVRLLVYMRITCVEKLVGSSRMLGSSETELQVVVSCQVGAVD